MKRSVVAILFIAALTAHEYLAQSATPEAPKKPEPATYVGNEVCQACHAPAFEKFSTTLMGKIFLHNPRNETKVGRARTVTARAAITSQPAAAREPVG